MSGPPFNGLLIHDHGLRRWFQTVAPPGELERAGALSNNHRPQRRERRGREDYCGGKFNFLEQKPFLCSFCGRNLKDSSKNWRGWQCRGSLLPPSNSLSKNSFDKL